MTRSKRKPIQNEAARRMVILADGGRTRILRDTWDSIIRRDRVYMEEHGKVPRFIRREQGKFRKARNAEDRRLKREIFQEVRAA